MQKDNPKVADIMAGLVSEIEADENKYRGQSIRNIVENIKQNCIDKVISDFCVTWYASKEDVMAMEECGEYIGLAFQIQDDILDLTGDEEEIGKPVGSDEKNHKTTYVTLKGLEQSAKDVEEISKKAIEILARYDVGDRYLTNLTRFLIHRTH